MFSLDLRTSPLRNRNGSRSRALACVLAATFCLLAAFTFAGCQQEPDDTPPGENTSLEGKWAASYGDYFVIKDGSLSYYGYAEAETPNYKGTVRYRNDFTSSAGVLIIEYANDGKPQYYEYGGAPNYELISGPVDPLGNFQGVYFKNRSASSVELAGAFSNTSPYGDKYGRTEKSTLDAAKAAFTLDNVDNYVTYWSAYAKQ